MTGSKSATQEIPFIIKMGRKTLMKKLIKPKSKKRSKILAQRTTLVIRAAKQSQVRARKISIRTNLLTLIVTS